MPKKMRDSLNEEQRQQRLDALHILLMNISLCHLKRNNPIDASKAAEEALTHKQDNPKCYYRLAVAQRAKGEYEMAKKNILHAINLSPGD